MAIQDTPEHTAQHTFQYDVVVIGGGTAGLQAALTLGRVHRRTLLLDAGSYRNDPAHHMQNFPGPGGTPPDELRAAASRALAAYDTVSVRSAAVASVGADGEGFRVVVGGPTGEEITTRGLVLATGLRDTLPDVPGLAEL